MVAEYATNGSPSSPQKEYGYRNGQLVEVTSGAAWGSLPVINDNPLNPHYVGETTVQARHITELRDAINALRTKLGMSAYSWLREDRGQACDFAIRLSNPHDLDLAKSDTGNSKSASQH